MGELFRSEEMTLAQLFLQSESAYCCVSELGEIGMVQFRDATFEKLENELKEINTNQEALKKNFLELTELKHILRRTQQFFDEMEDPSLLEESSTLLDPNEVGRAAPLRLGFVAGVIGRERIPTFERMLWRVCRGNVFLRQADIEDPLEDPATGDHVHKSVFIIFFQGDQLKNRVKKICEGFRASLYPCPETPQERKEMAAGVNSRIDDLQMVLNQTEDHRQRVLQAAAKTVRERSGSTVPSILNRMQTKQTPPTYNKTNKFTSGFQSIVDAYGIGNYREINPAPYTIITFPFLFAVMFGDLGHGVLMTCAALYLVLRETRLIAQKNDSEMFNMIFAGRYIILLMGVFSVYTGIIYNDCFSKSLNVFGSGWSVRPMFGEKGENWTSKTLEDNRVLQLNPSVPKVFTGPYPIGIDPIWNIATNKLTFLNSFKMKMSIILGVVHMTFGVTLSLFNHLYFKKPLNIFLGFIPEIVFMVSLFGYLVLLIFYKWLAYDANSSKEAPSLLIAFINMCLFSYGDPTNKPFYTGQVAIQCLLVIIAIACVPCMLIVKTLVMRRQYLWRRHLGTQNFGGIRVGNGPTEDQAEIIQHDQLAQNFEEDSPECIVPLAISLSDSNSVINPVLTLCVCLCMCLIIFQAVRGGSELSEVLWSMVMHMGLASRNFGGFIVLSFIFAAFATLTVFILLVMEGLSAFLHALRLHWVEFQNKFYTGQGFKFMPFTFDSILEGKFED
ncbi:V-type proton ATPase 116 kDa subunit a-like isoform X2 [Labeo rohita]|uniref:V-type proton ATPase subunit a n=1 Tax=Labeo rohita TaxID=84645 RepID=A0A498LWC4_LABRO|nr:V-type proton ATPase 116 kDa subunit a-like isoform X2 [Labeo rohita]